MKFGGYVNLLLIYFFNLIKFLFIKFVKNVYMILGVMVGV